MFMRTYTERERERRGATWIHHAPYMQTRVYISMRNDIGREIHLYIRAYGQFSY